MARYGSADVAFLLINGMSVLGTRTSIEDTREAITEETTVLGLANEEHAYVGVKSYRMTQQGFYDDAANNINASLVSPSGSKVLTIGYETGVIGKRFAGGQLVQVNYSRLIERNALHKANAEYLSEDTHDEGIILHALGARTADGNSEGAESQDAGASSANGGAGYLQLTALALGGHTALDVKIRHSADDSSYVDLINFTDRTAIGGERIEVAGTVNRHLAASWDFTGAGSPSATFFVGFARN